MKNSKTPASAYIVFYQEGYAGRWIKLSDANTEEDAIKIISDNHGSDIDFIESGLYEQDHIYYDGNDRKYKIEAKSASD